MDHNDLLDTVDVSARLRRACQEAGSAPAFARRIGVSPQFLSAVLHAKRVPNPAMLAAINLRRIVRYVEIDEEAPPPEVRLSISECLREWQSR